MKKIISLLLSAAVLSSFPLSVFADETSSGNEQFDTAGFVQTADTPDYPDTKDTPAAPEITESSDNAEALSNEDHQGSNDINEKPAPAETDDQTTQPKSEETKTDVPEITETQTEPDTEEQPQTPDEPKDTSDEPETGDEPSTDNDTDNEPDNRDTDTETDSEPPKDENIMGDVNGDRSLSTEDALVILRYSVGLASIDNDRRKYADYNGDGIIDVADALEIFRLTVEVESGSTTEDEDTSNNSQTDFSKFSRGIDVSAWQKNIDYQKVKNSGIDFVIIRAGYGRDRSQKDPYFEQNYSRAKAAGLKVGVYWYSYAVSAADARTEAQTCMWAISGKKFDFPIYFDLEENWQIRCGTAFCSSLVSAFCNELEKNGYYAGFYMSTSHTKSVITADVQSRYAYWAAEWNSTLNYYNQYGIWQYGIGYINGVNGEVDLDYAYIDYPTVMQQFHLNGY